MALAVLFLLWKAGSTLAAEPTTPQDSAAPEAIETPSPGQAATPPSVPPAFAPPSAPSPELPAPRSETAVPAPSADTLAPVTPPVATTPAPPPPPAATTRTGAPATDSRLTAPDADAARVAAAAPRPRFSFAIGAGASVDHSGLLDGRNVAVPAFLVLAGVGDGALGFESSLMSTQASGRYRRLEGGRVDLGVDRAALDAMLALRPFLLGGHVVRSPASGFERLQRSVTVNIGVTIERVAPGQQSAYRVGNVVAAHADLVSFTDPSDSRSFALRIGVRRMFASPSTVSMIAVSDTVVDSFLSLAAGF